MQAKIKELEKGDWEWRDSKGRSENDSFREAGSQCCVSWRVRRHSCLS